MRTQRSIVVNGDLGSGKTTVSILLAERLGLPRISVGGRYRALAAQLGMTALQLNLHSELDDKIDHYLDQLQRDIAATGEHLVIDSRLAWHFFADALKVHLIVDPIVAARRVLGRPGDAVENYTSAAEARARLASRSESERVRFLARYGVDKTRLRNYNLVCDTSRAAATEIVDRIIDHFRTAPEPRPGSGPLCYIDPWRIVPTDPRSTREEPLTLGYAPPYFFAVTGHARLGAAVRSGRPLVGADLVADAGEEVAGQPVEAYLRERVSESNLRAWERITGRRLWAADGDSVTRLTFLVQDVV